MGPEELYISKKLQRIIDLFNSSKVVTFNKVMEIGRYLNPVPAYQAVANLVKNGNINVNFDSKSNSFIDISGEKEVVGNQLP